MVWSGKVIAKRLGGILSDKDSTGIADLCHYVERICCDDFHMFGFRAQKRLQGEVSLSDSVETGGDGSLSLMDVIAVDDDMLENLDAREAFSRCGGRRGGGRRALREAQPLWPYL